MWSKYVTLLHSWVPCVNVDTVTSFVTNGFVPNGREVSLMSAPVLSAASIT